MNKSLKIQFAIIAFLMISIISEAVIFNDGSTTFWRKSSDGGGFYVGNTSVNKTDIVTDNSSSVLYQVVSYAGVIIGSYVDSYSCDGSYCIYQPWYAPGQVYAKNVSTGKIDYSGTNATTIFTTTSAVLNDTGGLIKAVGTFNFGTSAAEIYTNDNTKRTTIDLTGATISTTANNTIAFNITGGSVFIDGGRINGAVDWNPVRSSLLRSGMRGTYIFVNNVTGLYVKRVNSYWVYESSFSGLDIRNNGFTDNFTLPGMYVSTNDAQFYDIVIAKFGYGLYVTSLDATGGGDANTFNQFHIWGNRDGVRFDTVYYETLTNCWCEDNSRHGISVTNSHSISLSNNILNYNGHGQYHTYSAGQDISIFGTSSGVTVTSNVLNGDTARYGNTTNGAFGIFNSASANIRDNVITGTYSAIQSKSTTGIVTFSNNVGASPIDYGIQSTAPLSSGEGDKYTNSTSHLYCYRNSTIFINLQNYTSVGC